MTGSGACRSHAIAIPFITCNSANAPGNSDIGLLKSTVSVIL